MGSGSRAFLHPPHTYDCVAPYMLRRLLLKEKTMPPPRHPLTDEAVNVIVQHLTSPPWFVQEIINNNTEYLDRVSIIFNLQHPMRSVRFDDARDVVEITIETRKHDG